MLQGSNTCVIPVPRLNLHTNKDTGPGVEDARALFSSSEGAIVVLLTAFDFLNILSTSLCSTSRPDIALLWFLIPFKAAKHLVCDQYRWLTIKIVAALLLLAILALFLYNMPGYMVKKMLGA
ncbi:putative otoferlin-like [Scophthalmus maximus]|uniref:Putative otoferlin-like n=1 Tax=Scophthalmus maximus TaxID=52904 RepID=A0A2U9CIX1_SCOMX|nr:putative otoferlin-like [Scophthalmus maximus]